MKFERISDSIIRVTISLDDLEERNMDLATLNYNTPAAQEFFWDLMEQAEEQFGFSLSDSQLLIEPIPDSEEGFVLTISKIDEDGDFEAFQKYIKSRLKKSDLRVKKKSRRVCSTQLIYSFKNIDDIINLSSKLDGFYSGESSLHTYKGSYYLKLTRSGLTAPALKRFEFLLNEYGGIKIVNTNFIEGCLNEYGEVLIEHNAIELIKQYF